VQQVIDRLKSLGAVSVRTMAGLEEHVAFPLPKELSRKQAMASVDVSSVEPAVKV